jgi:hypothetical protein
MSDKQNQQLYDMIHEMKQTIKMMEDQIQQQKTINQQILSQNRQFVDINFGNALNYCLRRDGLSDIAKSLQNSLLYMRIKYLPTNECTTDVIVRQANQCNELDILLEQFLSKNPKWKISSSYLAALIRQYIIIPATSRYMVNEIELRDTINLNTDYLIANNKMNEVLFIEERFIAK